jgi:hypothetical protein
MIAQLSDADLDDHVWIRLVSRLDLHSQPQIEALHPVVQAWLVTRLFEWEVGNGGLRQYFLNFDAPWLLALIARGYTVLGLDGQRRVVEEQIAQIAFADGERQLRTRQRQHPWAPPAESQLDAYDELITNHDDLRVETVRANPELFAG